MPRVILHSDLNNFFASVELLDKPELRALPVAVCGSVEQRHGIVLAKNNVAKKYKIKTAMTVVEAKKLCPCLVMLAPHMDSYIEYSRRVRDIYERYTDQIEPFGMDECWLDVTGSQKLFGNGEQIANDIRKTITRELGLTVSIGVSFNKIFAKLGSDYKKPDAVTVFSKENFKDIVWKLDVSELLYVGKATNKALSDLGIHTIGALANTDKALLTRRLGKMGELLWVYANGYDDSPVMNISDSHETKSIGNSTTTPRDLTSSEDAKPVLYSLADSVATRMREKNLRCSVVELWVRNTELCSITRQKKLSAPTCVTNIIANEAYQLLLDNYEWHFPIRSIGVRLGGLTAANESRQLSLFEGAGDSEEEEALELSIDGLRRRFGHEAIMRAVSMSDESLEALSPEEHKRRGAPMYDIRSQH